MSTDFNHYDIADLPGADPARSISVRASAGSGKTWLLVTRLVRLLLTGCAPDSILALTFTNKAAGEMLDRLHQRLAELAAADDEQLSKLLAELGLETSLPLAERARNLYETLLTHPFPLRATTFHAFCQELLQRFALDAGIPPGFELLEDDSEHIGIAWTKLLADASGERRKDLGLELSAFLTAVGSLASAETALKSFLGHRLDWWVYCANRDLETIEAEIVSQFDPPESRNAALSNLFAGRADATRLEAYIGALATHGTKAMLECRSSVLAAVAESDLNEAYTQLRAGVLTKTGTARKYSDSKALRKSLGDDGAESFLENHQILAAAVLSTEEELRRYANCQLNLHWLRIGHELLENYQQLKRERRQLDFADLEWHACQLLNDPDMGHWVQYKLDAKIEHILVDEFQDTSPSQWQLLRPLLEEISAGNVERRRSAFIVGDEKQSIYAFRRADPRLLSAATEQLQQQAKAEIVPLSKSWRSSPIILDLVNRVFAGDTGTPPLIEDFPVHASHLKDRWGAVCLLPQLDIEEADEIAIEPDSEEVASLRNPLTQPRELAEDQRQHLEATQVATEIQQLIAAKTPVDEDNQQRPLHYGDVLILLRKRSHAGAMEQALRNAGIPFQGTDRNSFNNSLEVQDILALLRMLNSPWDNLATAQVLRSPLFDVSDADLIKLASQGQGAWLLRLLDGPQREESSLERARQLLSSWQALAGRIPVHDLLDKVFAEGEVQSRYLAAFPSALHGRLRRNFALLFRAALNTDSGRYPSLSRFLSKTSRISNDDASGSEQRVRIMTIHGAKGLEAPVVFVVNTDSADSSRDGWKTLVNWPPGADRPEHFALRLPKAAADAHLNHLAEIADSIQARESFNLLYVALTRARQLLYISGFPQKRSSSADSWYAIVEKAFAEIEPDADGSRRIQASIAKPALSERREEPPQRYEFPAQLLEKAEPAEAKAGDSPAEEPQTDDVAASRRGSAIHQLLEWRLAGQLSATALSHIRQQLRLADDDEESQDWLAEVEAVISNNDFGWLFEPDLISWNEVPVWNQKRSRYGVIDRLVEKDGTLWIIDYKTQRSHDADGYQPSDEQRSQLAQYAEAIAQIWPDKPIKKALLFTAAPLLIEL